MRPSLVSASALSLKISRGFTRRRILWSSLAASRRARSSKSSSALMSSEYTVGLEAVDPQHAIGREAARRQETRDHQEPLHGEAAVVGQPYDQIGRAAWWDSGG